MRLWRANKKRGWQSRGKGLYLRKGRNLRMNNSGPGGAGRLPARGSHRPERAQLTHSGEDWGQGRTGVRPGLGISVARRKRGW